MNSARIVNNINFSNVKSVFRQRHLLMFMKVLTFFANSLYGDLSSFGKNAHQSPRILVMDLVEQSEKLVGVTKKHWQ